MVAKVTIFSAFTGNKIAESLWARDLGLGRVGLFGQAKDDFKSARTSEAHGQSQSHHKSPKHMRHVDQLEEE